MCAFHSLDVDGEMITSGFGMDIQIGECAGPFQGAIVGVAEPTRYDLGRVALSAGGKGISAEVRYGDRCVHLDRVALEGKEKPLQRTVEASEGKR